MKVNKILMFIIKCNVRKKKAQGLLNIKNYIIYFLILSLANEKRNRPFQSSPFLSISDAHTQNAHLVSIFRLGLLYRILR